MRASVAIALLANALAVAGRGAVLDPTRGSAVCPTTRLSALRRVRGGGEPSDALLQATFACNRLYASVLAEATAELGVLRKSVAGGEAGDNFGGAADALLTGVAEKFAAGTPAGDAEVTALYAAKAEELASSVMTALEPVYVQQIAACKESALERFKNALLREQDGAEALAAAEASFVAAATKSVPSKTDWNIKSERASLVSVLNTILTQSKKAMSAKQQAASQMQTAMSYLQLQSQQMQALQAQFTGGQGGKWNLGAAYRLPDSPINLSAAYQQGRTNLQASGSPHPPHTPAPRGDAALSPTAGVDGPRGRRAPARRERFHLRRRARQPRPLLQYSPLSSSR